MKLKRNIIILVLFFSILFILNNKSYAGTQEWNSLDYNATVNRDGSMDIIETWDIYISETNTLFKDFNIDSSKYSNIKNVKVVDATGEKEKYLEQIYEEQYHVDSGCYYALPIKNNSQFEIAWNVGLDNSSANRIYKLYYTVENVIHVYSDCSELYWQFLGTENTISAKSVTGTITLPIGLSSIEKLRVWAHGPLNGEILKTSTNSAKFNLPSLSSGTMLEVRIVTDENIYTESTNISSSKKLQSILDEEQEWADAANNKRMISKILIYGLAIVYIGVFVFFISEIVKYLKAGKELNNLVYSSEEIKYFRDIPNEKGATPSNASYLYYMKNNNSSFENNKSKIFSATILDLALKGFIEFDIQNKRDINIKILPIDNEKVEKLTDDEKTVYKILNDAAKYLDKDSFLSFDNKDEKYENDQYTVSMKNLKKYAEKKYDSFYADMSRMCRAGETYQKSRVIDSNRKKLSKEWSNKSVVYFVMISILICFLLPFIFITFPIILELIFAAIICKKNSNKISILTEEGYQEMLQWKGLKNYMNDFSLLKDKEVPDLILWEKYLVYATAFGISKKVIQQLKVVYPELTNDSYYGNHYTYLYLMSDSRYGGNFIDELNHSVSSVYSAASSAYSTAHSSSSSGSGGGGGFSSGGGGRRRRWWLRWSLKIK